MKKLFACLMIFAALSAISAIAATTFTGVITDDMCGNKHTMMPGKSDAECVRTCVRAGAKFAVMANGKMYILAGKTSEVNALAGKKAMVSGQLQANTLTVSSITAAK